MNRICTSLHNAGYDVTLIGRERPNSKPLIERSFRQIRIKQRIDQGKLFYAIYNLKLFLRMLFMKMDAVCAIDLDTILPVYYISKLRRKPRVYDAHELFCEMEEVVTRPATQKMWYAIERHTVPNFPYGYTVNKSYVDEYRRMYGVEYAIVRNATVLRPLTIPEKKEKYILYQGAVNHGRCFEQLIPAMQHVDAKLIICGEGNFYKGAQEIAQQLGLQDKIIFKGYVPPHELPEYTLHASVGITLFVATSRSNELSLANRFFDYMHSGVPQLAARYPEYENINREFEIASLLDEITPETIATALNKLLTDNAYYQRLQQNCLKAREIYCWQEEEKRLLAVYQKLFTNA
ncbi:group 1 glycosyl transferase [Taibaiella soli]|uniref:Group 1 glycosyl transferase n=2 Tax=Taibaiella soli TaxID=1649169 RepID=A0A2W2B3Q8_9BACT|nr:group 1 glycosyl transferase [Taibaiella soli]